MQISSEYENENHFHIIRGRKKKARADFSREKGNCKKAAQGVS